VNDNSIVIPSLLTSSPSTKNYKHWFIISIDLHDLQKKYISVQAK